MKKLLMIAVIVAILISMVSIIPGVSAADDTEDTALVYKARLIDSLGPGMAYGEVMVWNNAEVKIKLFVEGVPGEQTYYFSMDYGPPISRQSILIGTITTDKKGMAIEFFDLSLTPLIQATTPGFVVRTQTTPPAAIAVTGFDIP